MEPLFCRHIRAHRAPEHRKKCRRQEGQKGKLARDPKEELIEAAMARAREEEEKFPQAVPPDDTIKERQAEVPFRRNPERLEFLQLHYFFDQS